MDFVYLAYCAGGGHFESSPLGNRGLAKCEAMAKSSYIGPRDPPKKFGAWVTKCNILTHIAPLYHTLMMKDPTNF